MGLSLGQTASKAGYITRLSEIAARSPSHLETALGYGAGRLSKGYFIGILIEPLRSNHVEFAGITLRSGGREGLPSEDPAQDLRRVRVHDRMLQDYGKQSVDKMLEKLANDTRNLTGPERIVKIFPVTPHRGENPKEEYPAGRGGPQYCLTAPHNFLIVVEVTPEAVARTAALWTVSVAEGAAYEGRAKLARYLSTVGV
jgi:hypothetical protein